jgi:hypothetical protein
VQEFNFIFDPDGANFCLCEEGSFGCSRNFCVSVFMNLYVVCPKSKCTDFPTHELVK